MTKFTVYNSNSGDVEYSGLSLVDAAQIKLGHDSHDYRVVMVDGWWELHTSQGSAASYAGLGKFNCAYTGPAPWGKRMMVHRDDAPTEANAFELFAEDILTADWRHNPLEIMTDAEWEAREAELKAELDAEEDA